MRFWITSATLLVAAGPACAQEVAIKPLIEARTRYEHLDQAEFANASDAVTIRVRAGVEVTRGRWVALGEAQGNLAVIGD